RCSSAASDVYKRQERERLKGLKVGLILSGANVDREVFAEQLAAGD
ncbi:hypothetical protein RBB72_19065, partial [Pseudomonas aeruginosa]|nr:hypothetical protein [Pseudomonas aeruginosa]